ncbi:MAG: VCBS repeat-containing protein [Flavobacteriaceae bacterium]|nr:VCBS repeat-containing protein [Flavobacteriaceae bacterium]
MTYRYIAFFVKVTAILMLFLTSSCSEKDANTNGGHLFRLLSQDESGLDFSNNLNENDSINYFNYGYMYMGGGVAIGDLDNDGLHDVYLSGNMIENKLYRNIGNLHFDDITSTTGTEGDNRWYTGVTFVDINADGWLDIYASVSGIWTDTKNQLFVNQGIDSNGKLSFEEMAEAYGIADKGNSVQGYFFDYDNDGDLDLLSINYPVTPFNTSVSEYDKRMSRVAPSESNTLYRNNGNGTFTDVTENAGILSYSLSLSASIADYNNDGWVDIYISNDFASPDLFYINNGDGTFADEIENTFEQTAFFGMGSDASDFNNDGNIDLFQLDMTPKNNRRSKANMQSMNPKMFEDIEKYGFKTQYMQNALQLNLGNAHNGLPIFSNIPQLAGVALTDWSWSSLFADLDNDGYKDLLVTNGTRREINNKDFFKKVNEKIKGIQREDINLVEMVNAMPSEKIENYVFKNLGDFTFENFGKNWGFDHKGFSNGMAYGDLDNDGDLDLVVNNLDEVSFVYENTLKDHNYIHLSFNGPKSNPYGIGSKVTLFQKGELQFQELNPTRGFQSSMPSELYFGVGRSKFIDSIVVEWPNGQVQKLYALEAGQKLRLDFQNGIKMDKYNQSQKGKVLFKDITTEMGLYHKHSENVFDDFYYQVLLPHKMSTLGPAIAVSDVNNDGLEDFYVGGAVGYPGNIFYQMNDGTFEKGEQKTPWIVDKIYEDVDAIFFDANNDGDADLYVVSGGNEFYKESNAYQDRFYLNDGKGNFNRMVNSLPAMHISGSVVRPIDFDFDGDLDLFVGGRQLPRNYPYPTDSFILRNDSAGDQVKFVDVTKEIAPDLLGIGMVTDGVWVDINNDTLIDLAVVGEWMPLTFLINENGVLVNKTDEFGMSEDTTGWWYSIISEDFDADGDMDFIAGNVGLNYKYRASTEEPFAIYADDFDNNKSTDIVLGYYNEGTQYPVRGRECSSQQIPAIKIKFEDYTSFSQASLADVYSTKGLENALNYKAQTFASSYIENLDDGRFDIRALPKEAQFSSVNSILTQDVGADGPLDLVLSGNLYNSEVETPRNDAGFGLYLKGDGKGGFIPKSYQESGLLVRGNVKHAKWIEIGKNKQRAMLFAKSNEALQIVGQLQ